MTGSAPGQTLTVADRRDKRRAFITPEGIDLELRIASAGARLAALVVDLLILYLSMLVFFLLMVWFFTDGGKDMAEIFWLLGSFVMRNFYFIGFEMSQRAATPGKRLLQMRVVARDGGRLTADAVVARNLIRELELFLPITMLGFATAEDMVTGWIALAGFGWTAGLSFFLLFNRDRMRMADLIAGTWVVEAPRAKLSLDLTVTGQDGGLAFTPAELGVYGVFELQELERVLRAADETVMRSVADTIRQKIGRPVAEEDGVFLHAYYRQLKLQMERGLLFGKRRANKFAVE
ncbi:MAG: hypothetical protein RLZZ58_1684 [Pseudomonadota bacterium]